MNSNKKMIIISLVITLAFIVTAVSLTASDDANGSNVTFDESELGQRGELL